MVSTRRPRTPPAASRRCASAARPAWQHLVGDLRQSGHRRSVTSSFYQLADAVALVEVLADGAQGGR